MAGTSALWGITDGSAGMRSQVQGVLDALGEPYVLKTCRRRRPFCWLPVAAWRGALSQLTPDSASLTPPWPTAVITSGRRSAGLALAIKAASRDATKVIHLTDPRACRNRFDLIAAMCCDDAEGPNILKTRLALHRLTPEALAAAAAEWTPRLAHLPRPWTVALIGGGTHRRRMRPAAMQQVVETLDALLRREKGSLLITPSRRTGEANIAQLRTAFAREKRVWLYDMQGDNPYLAMLALADFLVVSEESVNMLSEAAYTGKPLYLLPMPEQEGGKPLRFAASLVEAGMARRLSHLPLVSWRYDAPDERARVAAAIKAIL